MKTPSNQMSEEDSEGSMPGYIVFSSDDSLNDSSRESSKGSVEGSLEDGAKIT